MIKCCNHYYDYSILNIITFNLTLFQQQKKPYWAFSVVGVVAFFAREGLTLFVAGAFVSFFTSCVSFNSFAFNNSFSAFCLFKSSFDRSEEHTSELQSR